MRCPAGGDEFAGDAVRTPPLSASAITSVSNRLFPMPGGPSMTSTPPRPPTSAVTNAPITFNSPARPRIGGVTSRWPPTSKRPVEGPTRCPVYRLLHCHRSARHSRDPPIHAKYTSTPLGVHAIWGSAASAPTAEHPRRRPRTAGDRAGRQNHRFIGALAERFRNFSDLFLRLVTWHGRKVKPKPRPCRCPRETKTHVIVVSAWLIILGGRLRIRYPHRCKEGRKVTGTVAAATP
jgi:hypothetical protein